MEVFIFARFHAQEGKVAALEALLRGQVHKARVEPGCLAIDAYRSTQNPRLFLIHSRWLDEAAFDVHAALENTNRFVEEAVKLIDHPFDVTRSYAITGNNRAALP
jgi:quinol monooxygenase YgiN